MNYLIEHKEKGVNISLPSLRIDAFSLEAMKKVQDIRKSSLTFAPEAGSQRLRNVINKGLTEEAILNGAGLAFEGGWQKVKLYFMLGLPTETEEDRKEIPRLADKIARRYYEIPKDRHPFWYAFSRTCPTLRSPLANTPSNTVTSASCQLNFRLFRFNCSFISSLTVLALFRYSSFGYMEAH